MQMINVRFHDHFLSFIYFLFKRDMKGVI